MKTGKKYSLISLLMLVAVTFLTFALTACETGKDPAYTDKGEAGIYYTEKEDGEWTVSLAEGKFTLNAQGETKYGSYIYGDDKTINLVDTKSSAKYSGTLENGKMTLEVKGSKLLFIKKTEYVVTFKTGDGESTQTVINGKLAVKPQDPEKDGYRFVGWYTDEKYTAAYDFASTPVTGNVTLYGRMEKIDVGQNEYNVTYVVDGTEEKTEKTVGGVAYGTYTPTAEGKKFAGWWTSAYETAGKLTAKYAGEKLTGDTTLYAVWEETGKIAVSASADKIEWASVGANITYNVKITGPNGYTSSARPQTNSYEFDFAALEEGDYEVTVEYSTYTGKAYYKNKALAKVSGIKVIEPSVLVWNAVKNADYYTITVVCGNPDHVHKNLNNGKSTNYNFANCPMKEGGITFTVTAHAYGYADSASAEYTVERNLGKIGGIEVDASGDYVVWDTVEGATDYVATIKNGTTTTVKNLGGENTLYIGDLTGEIEVSVYAKAYGYNSSNTVKVSCTREKLAAPTGVRIAENRLYWEKVEGATGYIVYFDGTEYEVENGLTNYNLATVIAAAGKTAYTAKVKAVASDEKNNSSYSEEVKIQASGITALKYENGYLSWNPVANAYQYSVKVNGKETKINADTASGAKITFAQAGENEIEVCVIDGKNNKSSYVKITVTAYGVYFDARGGKDVETVYVAVGDEMTLAETTNDGYEFGGWYNLPGGPESNAKEYVDGEKFDGSGDIVLYAYWTSKKYEITLDVDGGAALEETKVKVAYNAKYTLPVPTEKGSSREGQKFNGWYTNPNGAGIQYANNEGVSLGKYTDTKDVTLYAYWVDIFSYTLEKDLEDPTKDSYALSKAPGFVLVEKGETVTVPAYYKDTRVQIINAGAFKNCENLTSLRIPNTISLIETGLDGELSSAFEGCSNLESIEIYEVEGYTGTPKYYSAKGMLISNSNDTKQSTIEFVPKGMTGSLVIPEGVEVIPEGIFTSSKITDVVIPYTVKTIGKDAFKYNYSLVSVSFEERPADYEAKMKEKDATYDATKDTGVTVARDAFPANYLETLVLPKHLYKFDVSSFASTKLKSIVLGGKDGTKSTGGYYTLDNSICMDGENAGEVKLVFFARGIEGAYTIPEQVTTICSLAFSGSKISAVTIGKQVTLIEAYAFSGTSDGKAIDTMGEYANVKNEYDEPAFKGSNCSKLTSITFEGKADSEYLVIKEGAFYDAGSYTAPLATLTLPKNLAELGAYAFGNISELKTVTVDIAIDVNDDTKYSEKAFKDSKGDMYVTKVHLCADVPATFSVGSVLGSAKLASVTVDENNKNFYSDENGILYDRINKDDGSYDHSTIIKYYPKGREGEFVIPATVTKIEGGVFAGATKLTKITIHEDVTYIGSNAFGGCTGLKEVVFNAPSKTDEEGKVVEKELEIGDEAFTDCKALTEITVPGRAKKLGKSVFDGCGNLVTASFEEGVTELGDGAFMNCDSLVTVHFPATLEKLGTYDKNGNLTGVSDVFKGCDELETIDIAEGNKTMMTRDGLFYLIFTSTTKTTDETTKEEKEVTETYYELVMAPAGKSGTVNIDAKTRKIWAYAFKDNTGITEITFGTDNKMEGTLEIGRNAFGGMEALKSITLPVGLETINTYTFDLNGVIETIVIPYTVTNIAVQSFPATYSALKNIVFQELPTTKTVKNEETGVTEEVALTKEEKEEQMKKYSLVLANGSNSSTATCGVFYALYGLDTVVLPERTTTIGAYAFYKSGVKKVVIPSSVTAIETGAFSNCANLTEVEFSGETKITAIPANCFEKSGIESIEIPEGIKTLSYQSFVDCKSLTYVKLPSTLENFNGVYTQYTGKVSYTTGVFTVTGKPNTSSVGAAFKNCTSLATVEFADDNKVTTIEKDTFSAAGLISIEIPANVTTIGANVFSSTKSLDTVVFKTYTLEDVLKATGKENESDLTEEEKAKVGKSNLTSIGNSAFSNANIKTLILPETTANELKLGTNMFYNVTTFEKFGIPAQVKSLEKVLTDCKSPVEIELSENNKSLKLNTEYNLILSATGDTIESSYGVITKDTVDLTKVSGLQVIKDSAFNGQTTIKNVIIPSSVTTIGANAFKGCTALETVTFATNTKGEASLNSLGKNAFEDCKKLKAIDLSATKLTIINDDVFDSCNSLASVKFNTLITQIGNTTTKTYCYGAFEDCYALKEITIPAQVATLGNGTFYGCKGLETVTFAEGSEVKTFPYRLFYNCVSLKSVELPATTDFTSLGTGTFQGCTALEEFTVPASIKELGENMFYGCKNLTSVTLLRESKDVVLGASAFATTAITSFEFEKITTIGASAFSGSAIVTADLSGVTSLGASAFKGCTALESVKLTKDDGTGLESLPDGLFENCTALTEITLPNNVTYLGKSTFAGSGLTSVYLPQGVTAILSATSNSSTALDKTAANTFKNCVNLTKVTTEKEGQITNIAPSVFEGCTSLEAFDFTNVQYIGTSAFKDTAIKGTKKETEEGKPEEYALDLSKVKTTGSNAFENCNEITEVTFGAGYNNAAASKVFLNCTGLKKVVFDNSTATQKMGTSMFEGCASLEEVTLFAKLSEIGTKAFYGTAIKKIEIPVSVKTIGENAFAGNDKLNTVTFADSTEELVIGSNAFLNCTALEKITLPDRITKIGNYAFQNCVSIDAGDNGIFTLPKGLKNTSATTAGVGNGAFAGCVTIKGFDIDSSNKQLKVENGLLYMTQYTTTKGDFDLVKLIAVPSGYEKEITLTADDLVMSGAFKYVQNVNTVTFEEGVTEIPASIMTDFTGLANLNLPSTLVTIGDNAFKGCTSLRNVNFSEGLETIGKNAFNGCTSLKFIELPSTLTTIKALAFGESGLTQVTLPAGLTTVEAQTFDGCSELTNVELNDALEALSDNMFRNCVKLVSFDLKNIKTIGTGTFDGCVAITSIDLKNVEEIKAKAFGGTKITEIVIPETVSTLGTTIFFNCDELVSVTLPETLEALTDSMFQGCTKLATIDLKNVKTIGALTFKDCAALEAIDFTGVTSIDKNAFENIATAVADEKKPTITIPASIETLGNYLFAGANVKEVKFDGTPVDANGNVTLPNYMFRNSTIEKVVLPEGLATLPNYTFEGCKNVDITYPTTLTTIGEGAFKGYEAETLTLPTTVTTVNIYVFESAKIDTIVIPDTVTNMKQQVFKYSTAKKIVIGKGIKLIQFMSFLDCAELEEVTLPDTIEEIEYKSFWNTTNIKKLVIPAGVFFDTGVSCESVFDGWTEEQTIYFKGSEDSYTFGPNWKGTGKMNIVFDYKGE